jgi:hypothetical protein
VSRCYQQISQQVIGGLQEAALRWRSGGGAEAIAAHPDASRANSGHTLARRRW